MLKFKNCIVIGAGNAGRPVARLLNHQGVDVTIADSKKYEEFTEIRRDMLDVLKSEGVKLNLGVDNPNISEYEAIYLAPTIPETAPIYEQIKENDITIVTSKTISDLINTIIDMDKIGITGSYGKTTTTTMITHIFKKAMETAGVMPDEVVHIGDSITSDIEPALLLGITPIYISRKVPAALDGVRVIRTLNEL